jgi:hypothetical protein
MKASLLAVVIGLLAVTSQNTIAAETTCADIIFSADIVSRYPDIDQACLDIVEHGGAQYAKLSAKVIRASRKNIVMKYMHQDGKYGDSYRTNDLPSDFGIMLDGQKTKPGDLMRNQVLNIYVKIGVDIATLMTTDEMSEAMEVEPVSVSMVEVVDELPKTAGWFYELLLAGMLLLLAGGSMSYARVRNS